MHAQLLQSCLTLCDPVDCSLPGSSVHGVLQARIPQWIAMPSSSRFSRPRDQTHVSCLQHWQPDSLPLAPLGSPKRDICQHNEVAGYKINVIKSVVFLYTNSKLSENVIKKLTPVANT